MSTRVPMAAGLAALLTLTSATLARADITMEQRISIEGVGIMSVGNMSGTSKTTISGDRSRSESDLQMQSRFARMLTHGALGPTAEIVRLDQGKIYHLDIKRKQYTEVTFDEMRAQVQKALDQANQNQQAGPQPVDQSKCEWLEPKADVKKTGEKATVAGFEAERLSITASQPCKDKETGAVCEVALALDEWLAPQFTAGAEATKFHRAYAQKLGLDTAYSRDISERAQSMFSRYKGIWSQLAGKMKDVKGYPVRMSFAFAVGGEQCKNPQAAAAQQQQSAGGESTPKSPGAMASQLGGKIAGALFHRKKDDSQGSQAGAADAAASATPASALPPGLVPLMTMSSELVSVSTDAAGPTAFDVPPDYKKTDKKAD